MHSRTRKTQVDISHGMASKNWTKFITLLILNIKLIFAQIACREKPSNCITLQKAAPAQNDHESKWKKRIQVTKIASNLATQVFVEKLFLQMRTDFIWKKAFGELNIWQQTIWVSTLHWVQKIMHEKFAVCFTKLNKLIMWSWRSALNQKTMNKISQSKKRATVSVSSTKRSRLQASKSSEERR